MPKVTYKCVDCGKESNPKYPSQFEKSKEEYRCYECAEKLKIKKVTYKCIDCGKEKTAAPSAFSKSKEEYRCAKCAAKLRSQNPKWLENKTNANRKIVNTPEWKEKHKLGIEKRSNNEDWLKNNKESHQKRFASSEYRSKMSEISKRMWEDPICRNDILNNMANKKNNPIVIENIRNAAKTRSQNIKWVENNLIHLTGEGFWYGNKSLINANNNGKTYYCELWNQDLWNRIDAAYDFKSILSGKTRFENGGISLTHHHLYWQPKACCVWDEDINGYYTWILNNGEWIKYYIKGDPNKFVLLTVKEHGMIRGKKGTLKDRIYWIKLLEDLVEERRKRGKKCYLSHEEYEVYKVEHADVIAKYKK
jgi:DNA-directed RNA polymerase subunit RPC12/RpoP